MAAIVALAVAGCNTVGPGETIDCSKIRNATQRQDCYDNQPKQAAAGGAITHQGCTKPDPAGGRCVTPRTSQLVQEAAKAGFWNPSSCWTKGHLYEHPLGRACDWRVTSGYAAKYGSPQWQKGQNLANWAVANAGRLGIMYIIWFGRAWNPSQGWHDYQKPSSEPDSPSGWHTNHVHISVY